MTEARTEKEIEIMRDGGVLLSRALSEVVKAVAPGITMIELDQLAERLLRDGGGEPSFKGYRSRHGEVPFPSTVCISVNNEVVHGPGSRAVALREGDLAGFDIGVWFQGLCTDMAVTVPVGKVKSEAQQLTQATRQALVAGLTAVRDSASVSDIGRAIEEFVKPYGYGIVRDLVGHGVGKKVHEDPHIPNYHDHRYDKVKLKTGQTIAIEPMLTLGDWRVKTLSDGWTIVTADGSLAAHFEVTVLVTENGYELITPFIESV
ncbi:type I methionyl aminopeptidase [Candidatus Uhrbacteria bacterium]|nr:type I methionyl aminopeptidase [Candidatus Uhrbacteria bacterium]